MTHNEQVEADAAAGGDDGGCAMELMIELEARFEAVEAVQTAFLGLSRPPQVLVEHGAQPSVARGRKSGPGGLTREVETPVPSNHPNATVMPTVMPFQLNTIYRAMATQCYGGAGRGSRAERARGKAACHVSSCDADDV
jgi:hypothetical protein